MLPAPRARFFATSSSLCINQIYFICSYMGIGIHRHSIPCRRDVVIAADRLKEDCVRAQSPEHETNVISRIAVDLGCQLNQLPSSSEVGSAFVYLQPFIAEQGDANIVTSITVMLANAQGTSDPKTAP